ncbi:DUF2250 domain-containing protein [Alicyclobacillaceae bacterium I2511]|jgi:predicted transcriptional regulator|nr:DUF2250 domain-containing protein [Alicyclobacillaceae bacterium I2511]
MGFDGVDVKILAYFKALGPDYAKLVAFRFGLSLENSRARLERLELAGFIEKVEGRIVKYYHRRVKAVKHRNHTYFQITKDGEQFLRDESAADLHWKKPKR